MGFLPKLLNPSKLVFDWYLAKIGFWGKISYLQNLSTPNFLKKKSIHFFVNPLTRPGTLTRKRPLIWPQLCIMMTFVVKCTLFVQFLLDNKIFRFAPLVVKIFKEEGESEFFEKSCNASKQYNYVLYFFSAVENALLTTENVITNEKEWKKKRTRENKWENFSKNSKSGNPWMHSNKKFELKILPRGLKEGLLLWSDSFASHNVLYIHSSREKKRKNRQF